MNKYFTIGIIMFVAAVVYVGYALAHPTFVININVYLLYVIYALYLIAAFAMLIIGKCKRKEQNIVT